MFAISLRLRSETIRDQVYRAEANTGGTRKGAEGAPGQGAERAGGTTSKTHRARAFLERSAATVFVVAYEVRRTLYCTVRGGHGCACGAELSG